MTNLWNKVLIYASGITLTVDGLENIPAYPNQPSLFIINHTSSLDIPLVEYVVGSYPHIWISKKIYGKIPVFGRLLTRMHILIDKENNRESARALLKLIQRAKTGSRHVLIFPEGTRSRSEKLLPFEPGFLFLARKLQWPIIPIALKNAAKIMSPLTWKITPTAKPVNIIIGKPIMLQANSTEEIIVELRSWFEHQLQ